MNSSYRLLTNSGELVTTVLLATLNPDVIQWGQRIFVRQSDGTYKEGIIVLAQNVVLPTQGFLGGLGIEDGV